MRNEKLWDHNIGFGMRNSFGVAPFSKWGLVIAFVGLFRRQQPLITSDSWKIPISPFKKKLIKISIILHLSAEWVKPQIIAEKMDLCRNSIPKHSTKNDWKKTCLFSSKSKQIRMTHLTRLTIICHWILEEIFRESDSYLAAINRRHRFIYQQFVGPCFLARMHDHSNLSPISHNFRLFSDKIELFSFPFLSQSD